MASVIYPGLQTFLDPLTGDVIAGGTVGHYIPGTLVDKLTYADPSGDTENDNPIQLDANGQCAIWGTGLYRQILLRPDGTQVWDRVTKVTPVTRPTPPSYTSLGVHFDGLVHLLNAALVATDNQFVSFSYWINFNFPPGPGIYSVWEFDDDNIANDGEVTNGGSGGPLSKLLRPLNLTANDFIAYIDAHAPDAANNNSWHHILVSATLDGTDAIRIYIDGADATQEPNSYGTGDFAFNGLDFHLGLIPFGQGYPHDGFVGDLAQFWFAPGQTLLTAGDIPPATVAKFYSVSGPVDLGSDGSTPTGVAPAIYLDRVLGDDPSAFLINKGTGGNFTSIGTDDLIASETVPPTAGISWPLPIIVGDPIVGQTLSYTLDWPRDVISITQDWRRTTTNSVIGTGATLVVPGGDLIGLNIYLVTYVTDALGYWPNLSSAEGVYCGPVTT